MPAVAVGAVLTGAVSVGVVAATSGLAAVTLATFAVPAAISLGVGLLARAFAPKPPSFSGLTPPSGAQRGATERTLNDPITAARWIIGAVRVQGKVVWVHVDDDAEVINADTSRDTVSTLHMAQVLSESACDGIQEIWLDGDKLTTTKTIEAGHNVFRAPGFELHEYFKADGTQGAECFAAATGADLAFDSSTVKGEGLSWVYMKFTQNDYGNDLESRRYSRIPRVEYVIKGIKIRRGRDPKGSSALAWTENAAIVRKWWLTERRGIDWNRINNTYYRAARTRCDTMIDISNLTNFDSSAMSTNLLRYTINGLIHSGDDVTRIEQDMDFAWDGSIVDWDGELLFRPGGARASVRQIVGEDIVENVVYRPGTTLGANRYLCDIPQSEWHDYLPYTLTVDDAGKQAYDGQILTLNLGSTDLVSNPAQAANLLRSAARRARASSSIEMTISPGEEYENTVIIPGDKITLTLPELSINDQDFFVIDSRVLPGWAMKLTLTEWGSDWYDDDISLDHYSPRQVTAIGSLSAPTPVNVTIAAAKNDDGTFIWYALLTMPKSVWQYHIRYKLSAADDNTFQEALTAANQTTLILNTAGEWTFEVRAQSRDGRQSPATTVTATASFDIELPATPALARKTIENGYLRYVFINLSSLVNAIEIAYTFSEIGGAAPAAIADADEFEAATLLNAFPIVPAKSLTDERTIVDQFPAPGQYNLYARVRDIAGRFSGILHLGLESLRLDAPGNVDVDELGDGTRAYTWTLAGSQHIAGVQIRYKRAGDFIPQPGPIENAPPTLIAANTNEDGDVILAYSEPLDDTTHPATSAYSISVDGTSATPDSVAIDKNTVLLTLTTAITAGQAVTITYTVPNTNPLQDTHGDAAAALNAHVVNNTLRTASTQPSWSSMEPLNEGYLTSSPYLTKSPAAGIWDFAFRTQGVNGQLSVAISYVQKALNEPVQLDIVTAVEQAIADNPALITLTGEVDAAEAARDRAIKAAVEGEAFKNAAETAKSAAETAKTAAEQAETNVKAAKSAVDAAKDDAETAASTAQSEASKASASAGKAATSESNADGSEQAAAAHVTSAQAEATKAGRSASAAATSATTAASEASDASDSATAAETAETNAETAQSRAETAESNAASSATGADGSAKSAASSLTAVRASASEASASKDAAKKSADASASSAQTAASEASDAGDSADAASSAQTAAETAQGKAETAETNASSSATRADGSAKAAASSATGISAQVTAATNAKNDAETAKTGAETAKAGAETAETNAASSATAAASSASTAAAEATKAGESATASATSATSAQTSASNAGTSETNSATSATNADGSATSAASSAQAAAASATLAQGAGDSATAASASATTASAKATEAATSAAAAEVSKTSAETAASNAATSETNAAASETNASGSAAIATTEREAAAGFAQGARQAVAGITQTVSAQIDSNLRTTFASIIALRAIAGEAKAKLELVALSDPSGSRAAGVMTGDLQSFDYAPAGGSISGARGRAVVLGIEFLGRNVRDDDNGFTITLFKRRRTGNRDRAVNVVENTGSDFINIFLDDDVGGDNVTFNRANIATAINSASTILRASGSGNVEIDFSDADSSGVRIARGNLSGGRDNVTSKDGTGWIIRRNGTAEFDAASIRGVLSAAHIDSNVQNAKVLFESTPAEGVFIGTNSNEWRSVSLADDTLNYDTLIIQLLDNAVYFETVSVTVSHLKTTNSYENTPVKNTQDGTTNRNLNWDVEGGGHFRLWRTGAKQLQFRAYGTWFVITQIVGIRQPTV